MRLKLFLALLASIFLTGAASAVTLGFSASLDGRQEVPPVSTDAFGSGSILVDTETENLLVSLDVTGIGLSDLRSDFLTNPIGPVHLHLGAAGVNGPIAVPFTFNSNYQDTSSGFSLETIVSFASSAALPSFDDFLTSLNDGLIYFNVHTNAFLGGEIRGQVGPDVAPVPLPTSGLMLAGVIGFGLWRSRRKSV